MIDVYPQKIIQTYFRLNSGLYQIRISLNNICIMKVFIGLVATTSATLYPTWETTTIETTSELPTSTQPALPDTTTEEPLDEAQTHIRRYYNFHAIMYRKEKSLYYKFYSANCVHFI